MLETRSGRMIRIGIEEGMIGIKDKELEGIFTLHYQTNFALTAPVHRTRATSAVTNCPRMNRATTLGGNCPNHVLAIEGNPNQGNNRNRAQLRAFALGVAEAP
ncbi:hypothetical protein Tco_1110026 [Tanacetum coccineum]|uniref:Uncharacterized protein n=1 Tax=Tanacetum coccineum TaxID=301880 RepID=A0ABQ5IJR2_9ASTR